MLMSFRVRFWKSPGRFPCFAFWLLLLAIAPLVCVAQSLEQDLERTTVSGPLGERLDSLMTANAAAGFSGVVLIISQDRVLLHKGYGYADIESRHPHSPTSLFEMASVSKTITAAAILRLQDQGRLAVSQPIAQYLPDVPAAKAQATVHHLATHTAGLVPRGVPLSYDRDREAFLSSIWSVPLETEPGTSYRYTNAGYGVLAALVEVLSGESFESYVRREVFGPSGMAHARFTGETPSGDERLVRGHAWANDRPRLVTEDPYDWSLRGAAGVVTTVSDLYRWHLGLRQGKVLSPGATALMFHPWPVEGYGWHVEHSDNIGGRIHKGGGLPYVATQILYYPGPNLFVAWAANDMSRPWRRALNDTLPAVVLCDAEPLASATGCAHRTEVPDGQ